jgi:(p)ppGpp synthase/HD superfamily hydrolase
MDPRVAQQIACTSHAGQRTRFGDPVIEHLERVANAVAPEAQAIAWLHDLFELASIARETLRACGLTAVEALALELLTRIPAEPYEEYILKIACASGRSGQLARTVKLADLEDHLRHPRMPAGAPPYAWAHQCVLEQRGMRQLPALAG